MFPAVTIKTLEFEKLNQQLEGLEADLRVKARKAGLLSMASPLVKDVRASTPRRTGALRASIGHQWIKSSDIALSVGSVKRITTGAIIKTSSNGFTIQSRRRLQDYKMRWLEEGTKPHMLAGWINGKRQTTWTIRGMNDVGRILPQSKLHPGIKAQWIQRNAFNRQQPQFLESFTRGAARALAKYGVTAQ